MRRSIMPSLNALTAFESAARHQGIVRASEELHLSQSAVSRLVKQVEDALQVKLFDRIRQRLVLTDAGKSYARTIRKMFQDLEQSTFKIMAYGASSSTGALNLGVFSTFGTRWLIPRLGDFRASYPNAVISCFVRPKPFSFVDDPLDAAIHYGDPVWPGAVADPLFGERIVAVASPGLAGIAKIRQPGDLLDFPLLHETTRPQAWSHWLDHHKVSSSSSVLGARFDQFAMMSQAAQAGLGVALIPEFLIAEELRSGALQIVIPGSVESEHMYYLVYPEWNLSNPLLLNFRHWLRGVCAADEKARKTKASVRAPRPRGHRKSAA